MVLYCVAYIWALPTVPRTTLFHRERMTGRPSILMSRIDCSSGFDFDFRVQHEYIICQAVAIDIE